MRFFQSRWLRSFATVAALMACLGAGEVRASVESDVIDQAKQLLRSGDPAGCVTLLEPLAAVSPDDVEAQAILGIAKNEIKDYAGAIRALERAKVLDPVNSEIRNQLGLSYAESGDFARALPELEYVFGRAPETPDVGYRLGHIHYSDTRYPPARDVLTVTRASSDEVKQRVLYLLGLTYERLGDPAQADKNLRLAIQAAPNSELAKKVQSIVDETPATTARVSDREKGNTGEPAPTAPLARRKKLGVDAYLAGLYDNNARLDPRTNPADVVVTALRARPGRRSSGGANVAVRPEYSFRDSDGTRLSVNYAGSHTEYASVTGLDFTNHQIGFNAFHQDPANPEGALFAAQFAYDNSDLGSVDFLERYSFAPSITWQNSERATVAFGLVQRRDFAIDSTTVAQEVRDGTLVVAGATHYRFFSGGRTNVRFGLQVDSEDTRGSNYDYDGIRPSAGVAHTFGPDLTLSFDALHHRREYDNVNTVFARGRTDSDTLLIGRASKGITRALTGFVEYTYNEVHSSVPVFEYKREVGSVGLHYRY